MKALNLYYPVQINFREDEDIVTSEKILVSGFEVGHYEVERSEAFDGMEEVFRIVVWIAMDIIDAKMTLEHPSQIEMREFAIECVTEWLRSTMVREIDGEVWMASEAYKK